jgi:hypothetical protein
MMRAGALLVCLAFALSCGRDERDRAPAAAPVAAAKVDAQGRLDPAPYRVRIEAAEALLYSDEELSEDGWKALSKALLELHNEIVFHDVTMNAREASARLFFLSARADAMKTARRSDAELAQLRELWRQLSAEKFAPADWIRAQAPDP